MSENSAEREADVLDEIAGILENILVETFRPRLVYIGYANTRFEATFRGEPTQATKRVARLLAKHSGFQRIARARRELVLRKKVLKSVDVLRLHTLIGRWHDGAGMGVSLAEYLSETILRELGYGVEDNG